MRAITTTGILLAVLITGYPYQKEHPQPYGIQAAGQYAPPKAAAFITEPASTKQEQSTHEETKNYLKRAVGPEFLAAWVLVVAAGIGLYVTWRTAQAAFLNAQAVINAERPWLVVTVVPHNALNGHYFFRVTNKGKTPAIFVSANFGHKFAATPDDLPTPPQWEPFIAPNNRLLPPEDFCYVQTTFNDLETGINVLWRQQNRPPDIPPTDILFFYGNIVYQDVLNRELHETRWCSAFMPSAMRFVTTGPNGQRGNEYNQYT